MGLYEILHGSTERRRPQTSVRHIDVEAYVSSPSPEDEGYQEPLENATANRPNGESLAPELPVVIAAVPPAPLYALPTRWGLEIQRISHYLSTVRQRHLQVLTFSGLTPGGGVTTVSYMVAHHLASSISNARVLYLEVSLKQSKTKGSNSQLTVGQSVDWTQMSANCALTTVSVRGDLELSVAEKMRWFQQLIAEARTHYRQIIIDAPSFYGDAETYLLAGVSDGVVLVLKSGATRRAAVNALIAELQQMNIDVIGAVINFREYPIPRWLLRWL